MRERNRGGRTGRSWRKTLRLLWLGTAFVLSSVAAAPAVEIEVTFTASLAPGSCSWDCLGAFGGTVSGTWVFESTATGSGTNPKSYPLQSIDFTTAFSVVGGATGGTISIANNLSSPPTDGYTVGGTGTFGTFAELTLTNLSIQLLDTDGLVFTDTSLPESLPALGSFETARVYMTWKQGGITIAAPAWDITSLSSTVISGGDCCSAHAAPGCDITSCETDVCAADSSCCTSGWDSGCATLAASLCTACGASSCTGLDIEGPREALDEQDPATSPFGVGGSSNQMRGWRFRPVVSGLVANRLGVNTALSDSVSHTVTLFDFATQAVLAQASSPIGSGWQWVDIPPVPLVAGNDYVVQVHSTAGSWYYYGSRANVGSSWFPIGPLEYIEMRYANSAPDPSTFPTSSLADFQYGLVDVGYAYTACVDVPGPGAGEIVDTAFGPPGKSFELFANERGMLLDLDVGLRLYNALGSPGSSTMWDDFSITLSKGGRSWQLNANPLAGSGGLFDVVFDAEASTSIASAKGGGAVGTFRPDGPVDMPFEGVMVGGPWTLTFEESTNYLNETRLEGWELLGQVMEEQAILHCDDPAHGTGGDLVASRGVRFHVDRSFQGVRADLSASVAGPYRFDVELRRSTGFTAPVETVATMEANLLVGSDVSVPVYFGDVEVSGLESFTLKFKNFTGPGSVYIDTFGIGNEPCPNVEETDGNTSGTPSVRGDPADFSVISVPEPGVLWMLASGIGLLTALERRRRRR